MISEILGLFINTLTTDNKSSLGNKKNFCHPIQMKLCKCFLYVDTLVYKITDENSFVNIFSLSYEAITGMKKKDLVDHIENLKGKVVFGNDIQGLFNQISKLSKNVDRLVTANDKLNSELLIVRNVH